MHLLPKKKKKSSNNAREKGKSGTHPSIILAVKLLKAKGGKQNAIHKWNTQLKSSFVKKIKMNKIVKIQQESLTLAI